MPRPSSQQTQLEWKERILQQQASGLSIEKWCSQNQISPHNFTYWRDKLFPKQLEKSHFTELNIKRSDAISLQARGIHIHMGSDCDPHLRKQIFTIFAELSC